MITEEQVLHAEEKLLKSIKESDVQGLEKLIHTHLLFHIPNGAVITKELDIQAYRSRNMKVEEIDGKDHIINIVGDTAVVSVLVQIKGEAFGEPLDGAFRYLRIWKLVERDLKVIAGSCIKM